MDEEDIIPADPLARDAAVVVSETDAAHSHSSGDEEEGWLATRYQRRRIDCSLSAVNETDETSRAGGGEDDSDDETEMKDAAGPGDLYCKNMDDEDEAWVYKNMRSGREELVHVRKQHGESAATAANNEQNSDDENSEVNSTSTRGASKQRSEGADNKKMDAASGQQESPALQNPQLQQARLLRPRTSDAILSCPRCFNIVCMDCQQHDRYVNQYRAMFVMNIGVDWNKRMVYDDAVGGLKFDSVSGVERRSRENNVPMQFYDAADVALPDTIPHDKSNNQEKDELYYSVHCSYCQLELAALNMKDEIYHFFGCIASA